MKRAALTYVSLLAGLAWTHCLHSQSIPKGSTTFPTGVDLLLESYSLGANLTPVNRCRLLLAQARVATALQPALGVSWAEELFLAAQELPPSWDQGTLEKNAIEVIHRHNPTRAFQLIGTMAAPFAIDGVIPEDLRAFVAAQVYPVYWKQRPSEQRSESIRNQARAIGANGQYPLLGTAPILIDLEKSGDSAAAHALFTEALEWFRRGSRIRDTDVVFSKYMKAIWNELSPSERSSGIHVWVKSILRDGDLAEKKVLYTATVKTSKGTYRLSDPRQALALKMLPEILEVDPSLLEALANKQPVFAHAKEPGFAVLSVSEAHVISSGDGGASSQAVAVITAEQAILDRVMETSQKNPAVALRLALSLSHLRDDALEVIRAALEGASRESAAGVSAEASGQLEKMKDKSLRLAMIPIQLQAGRVAGEAEQEAALQEGFRLGADLFEEFFQAHPTTAMEDVPALTSLQAITREGMRVSPWNTLGQIRTLGNVPLRAWLLIAAAEVDLTTTRIAIVTA